MARAFGVAGIWAEATVAMMERSRKKCLALIMEKGNCISTTKATKFHEALRIALVFVRSGIRTYVCRPARISLEAKL